MVGLIVAIGVVLGLFVLVAGVIVTRLIHICAPNEVLIFSGKHRKIRDSSGGPDRLVGYRLIQGGRGIRIPLFERVDRLDLTNMIIDLRVRHAYSKGGIPLNVDGVANLKIASTEPIIGNAIERLLGKTREQIIHIAKETLEGNLRGVLATLTPEEVNTDRLKFAQELLREAEHDLKNLGLELDTLKIQNVADDKGYLDSLGRKQSAELIMRSRIAEAENRALAAERSAENFKTQEQARIQAGIETAKADAHKRILDAQTKKGAMIAEERSTVTAAVAKATAELDVQRARIEQVKLQLDADRIKPAIAHRTQLIESARGNAAKVIEEGKATAEALRQISRTWDAQGDSARQIFVAQKLSGLVEQLMSTVSALPIDKVTVIDRKLNVGDNLAVKAAVTSEQLKHTVGVDVPELLNKIAGKGDKASPPPTPWVPPANTTT
jgi:flotillin